MSKPVNLLLIVLGLIAIYIGWHTHSTEGTFLNMLGSGFVGWNLSRI